MRNICKRHGLELAPNFYQIVEGHIKKCPYKKSRKRHYEKRNNYNIDPVKYYSKIWKLPARDIKDFIEIYEYNNKIWQFRRFKKWFSVSCHLI